jgi:hypothetical protein
MDNVVMDRNIERRDESYIGKRVERMEVRGRKGRGRPKRKWERLCESRLE